MSNIMRNLNKHCSHIGPLDISIDTTELSVHSHYRTQVLFYPQSKYQKSNKWREKIEEGIHKGEDERIKWFV